MLIGDADWSMTLGPEEQAWQLMSLGTQAADGAWTWPDGSNTGLLLPTSRTRSYYSACEGNSGVPADTRRIGRPRVWLGRTADGEVSEVVADLLSAAERQPEQTVSAWVESVGMPGGSVLTDQDGLGRHPADIAAAFEVTDDFVGWLDRLGEVHLDGQLTLFDPGAPGDPATLPVDVQSGLYPVFTVAEPEIGTADLMLIRLGDERPVRWLHEDERGAPWNIGVETGSYVLTDEATRRLLEHDGPAYGAFYAQTEDLGHGVGDFDGSGFVLNNHTFGDGVAWCYIGVAAEGWVTALVLCMADEPVWAVMPPETDHETFTALAKRIAAGQLHDDEITSYRWPRLLALIEEEQGRITRSVRTEMYSLKDHIDNERD